MNELITGEEMLNPHFNEWDEGWVMEYQGRTVKIYEWAFAKPNAANNFITLFNIINLDNQRKRGGPGEVPTYQDFAREAYRVGALGGPNDGGGRYTSKFIPQYSNVVASDAGRCPVCSKPLDAEPHVGAVSCLIDS